MPGCWKSRPTCKEYALAVAGATTVQLARRALELGDLPAMRKRLERYRPAEVLERPYRLIYRVTPTQVEILSVLHHRQLMPTDLANLHDRGVGFTAARFKPDANRYAGHPGDRPARTRRPAPYCATAGRGPGFNRLRRLSITLRYANRRAVTSLAWPQ